MDCQQPFTRSILGLVREADPARSRTLLRDVVRLYVSEPWHTHSEQVMFDELAGQLIKVTGLEDRVEVARALAGYGTIPPLVLKQLLNDIHPVASVLLREAPALPEIELLSLIATGPTGHLELIAARPHLSQAVVEGLLNKLPPALLPVLLTNPAVTLPANAIPYLVDLGRKDAAIARALAARLDDVQDTDLIELFLMLDSRGRRRVIQALEIAALREFAARRPAPQLPLPDPEAIAALGRACLSRDTPEMAGRLAHLAGIPVETATALLADEGGEPLAVALKAAGIDLAMATRVILFSGAGDTRSYFEVKRLVDLYDNMSLRSAVFLADSWRGSRHEVLPRRRYVAQMESGTPVRSGEAAARTDMGRADVAPAAQPLRRDRA